MNLPNTTTPAEDEISDAERKALLKTAETARSYDKAVVTLESEQRDEHQAV